MLSWIKGNAREEPVRIVQDAIVGMIGAREEGFTAALAKILVDRLWERQADNDAQVFTSFAAFAMAPRPAGLGIRSSPPLKLLRRALLDSGYFPEWIELLKLAMRTPGRPRKSQANDEASNRFYTVSTPVPPQIGFCSPLRSSIRRSTDVSVGENARLMRLRYAPG